MFGKGHFEGDFRTKPVVSIRGATKAESKTELLRRAHKDRLDREARRRESAAVTVIQSTVRGFLDRRRVFRAVREQEIPALKAKFEADPSNWNLLLRTAVLVLLAADDNNLVWIFQVLVKERQRLVPLIESSSAWQHVLCKLTLSCLRFIATTTQPISSCLRFLEIYTAKTTYSTPVIVTKIYKYLIPREYFLTVRTIIDSRVPPVMSATVRPPTPVAGEILRMVLSPVSVAYSSQDADFKQEMFTSLAREILAAAQSEQIQLFILPALASSDQFSVGLLVQQLEGGGPGRLRVPSTCQLLYSILVLSQGKRASMDAQQEQAFFNVISILTRDTVVPELEEEEESDAESDSMDAVEEQNQLVVASIKCLNSPEFVSGVVQIVERSEGQGSLADFSRTGNLAAGSENVRNICKICHQLLIYNTQAMHDYAILHSLAFRPFFLRQLWQLVCSTSQPSLFGSPTPLISIISRGFKMNPLERDAISPPLAVFSSLFRYLLVTIHDTEFYGNSPFSAKQTNWMPFTLNELVTMSLTLRDISLGLIELAFPESRPMVREDYKQAVNSVRITQPETQDDRDIIIWTHLFKTVVSLVRQLYLRDTRRQFCPENHWISAGISLPLERPQDVSFGRSRIRAYRPFRGLRVFTREEMEESGPPLSTKEVRLATVLRELPFTIAFSQRVIMFQNLVQRDKHEFQGDRVNFLQGPSIDVVVRRNYIYEDAFDKLSVENEPNMKLKMRVQLVNVAGMDEAGIDGGGLFREFLSQLLKAAFDPNRGFFVLTRDQHLYPNPTVNQIHGNAALHYFFIGRILGKALYENLLVELPLATFFLSKLLGQKLINVDIDHLDSLDPELYKNLLYLKTYEGDVLDLGLDFTVAVEEFGETRVILLKPGGDDTPVTSDNRIEYIHLMADFKLNRQIRTQCIAFRNGLEDVIGLDWLRMFSYRELETLISGAEHAISVEDLQANTNYSGGYTADHPTIKAFWEVVVRLAEDQKRSLLKFVTSCSRPPLLGFRDLDPPFCVQNAGGEHDRLPTASTCMNLLKLPDFRDSATLKQKLLYAIEAGAGFELS